MKCYYEILQVEREADDNEIKTAYRKLALKWHPDKNLDNTELAKEQFQLVQQAYDVLSDRQERAWYDKHRDSILHGANSDYKDDSVDIFPYFTTSCFKGYGDNDEGFYGVYRKVFDQLIEEDMKFIDNKDDFINIPRFGNSTSDYDEIVGPFYDYWMSYNTKKTFTWLDPFDIRGIGNRRAAKLAEKENEKIRLKAKKERNEEIRNLVAFVRKRDKRVQAYRLILEARTLENREKQQRLAKEKKLERIKLLNNSNNEGEWMKFDNVKSQLEEVEKSLADEFGDVEIENESEDEVSNLYCEACNKMFKNPNAFKNHESSKKHKENVSRLREILLDDDELENINTNSSAESEIEEIPIQKSKKKKNKKVIRSVEEPETDLDENILNNKNEKSDEDQENDDVTKDDEAEEKKNDQKKDVKKIKKEKRKNKMKEASGNANISKKEINTDLCCAKCKNEFPTKNKLFDHLKKTGHSIALPQVNKSRTKKEGKN